MERHQGGDAAGTDAARFDQVVGPLLADPHWRRSVRLAHLRHWAVVALRCGWNGLADVGCWFTCVPTQRCESTVGRRAAAGRAPRS